MMSCCESPQQSFKIRNDGNPELENDKKTVITLPEGVISEEGLGEIGQYLRRQYLRATDQDGRYAWVELDYDVRQIGQHPIEAEWQTNRGNYTKRLSKHAYEAHGVKLSQDDLSAIGNLARDHSKSVNVEIAVTRKLNMSARSFYHEDSCWWGSYNSSRCALKTNGGYALRSFTGGPVGRRAVTGRAWVLPLRLRKDGFFTKKLTPTFNTLTPDALVVFNGYGELTSYTPARIMSHMAGWTYKKIYFSAEPMYVNSGGYLVAPEEIAQDVKELHFDVQKHSRLFEIEKEEGIANVA